MAHPKRGMVSPGEFIPLAEEIGLIVPLGEWVIRQACARRSLARRCEDRRQPFAGAIRKPRAGADVLERARSPPACPERLELEITENVLLQDNEATLATLHQLRALGVRIAMDDFGTGYSSLRYLQSFPFDKIKIDRSFVRDIAVSYRSLNIVRALPAMAKGLGMRDDGGGRRDTGPARHHRSEGCTEMQGFLFCRPQPANEIERLLSSHCVETRIGIEAA